MGRPALGTINLPKNEVIRILTEKKAELETQLATSSGADGKIKQWEKDVEDWDQRVGRAISEQLVDVNINYTSTLRHDVNPYSPRSATIASVTITPENIQDVFDLVGPRPTHPTYPTSSYEIRNTDTKLKAVNSYIALLNISPDLEIRLRPSDEIARLIT